MGSEGNRSAKGQSKLAVGGGWCCGLQLTGLHHWLESKRTVTGILEDYFNESGYRAYRGTGLPILGERRIRYVAFFWHL